jgi:hypothetical protein
MTKRLRLTVLAVAFADIAGAQVVPDHLACFKVRDNRPPGFFTMNVAVSLMGSASCRLKVPAKQMCLPATNTGVTPPPPPGGPHPGVDQSGQRGMLCYSAKCPLRVGESLAVHDELGIGVVTFRTPPKILCIPTSPSGAFLD